MKACTLAALVLPALLLAMPADAAQRAFVASTGNDANGAAGCTIGAPCRSFQVAHSVVDVGGEIVALDTAGYGAVAISKSVTIMANPGSIGGVAIVTGDGVTISNPGATVVLRGLNLNDVGTGGAGIEMTNGSSLHIENCVVARFSIGLSVSTPANLKVVNSVFRDNNIGMLLDGGVKADIAWTVVTGGSGVGIALSASTAAPTSASVSDTVSSHNFNGFSLFATEIGGSTRLTCIRCTASHNAQNGYQVAAATGASASMMVSNSAASYNVQHGFANVAVGGASTFTSLGNNALSGNGTAATSGTINTIAGF